jgi:mono/diheme cytochrome c family protein
VSLKQFRIRRSLTLSTLLLGMMPVAVEAATNNVSVEIRDTLHGHFVYMKNCAVCHGRRGDGRGEMGLTVKPPPRDFAAGVFKYRSTPSGHLPTNEDLRRTIREGIPDTAMPIFSTLPERDVQAVVEYLKTFSPRWRQAENYATPIEIPSRPSWFADPPAFERHATKGRKIFVTACAACHGENGRGEGSVTNLVDAWGNPTPPRDLRQPYIRSGRRLEDIYKSLVTGIDGTPMPSFAEGITEEQRWDLVALIESWRRREPNRD